MSELPPPRTARTPRSRGIFSGATEPSSGRGGWRWFDLPIVAFAVAVAAVVSALVVIAPAAITGPSAGFNPGPAMVGAASVAPAFIETSPRH